MAAQYRPGVTAAELATLHRRWQSEVGDRLRPARPLHAVRPDPDRRLRVGLVSADLRAHPVGYFAIGAVEAFDPAAIEVVAYAANPAEDAITRRFRARAALWRTVAEMEDAALAGQIARDGVDILIDLGGHTRHARLPVFARRPAPVQITWAGYVGTTGLIAMDGLLADRFQVPHGEDDHYTETVIRLPDGYVTFDPPAEAPEVGPLPAGADEPLTFASFHNPAKINPATAALWARLLHEQPGARIVFLYPGYDIAEVPARIRFWFAGHGIDGGRLVFLGGQPRAEVLARYGTEIDIALDPLPYSGGLTTLEALWMGVPVVTLPGQTFAGRHAASHLSVAGLAELVARDAGDYLGIVRRLGADRDRLAALRDGLRARVAASPLCDTGRFARNLEAALRGQWRRWCAGAGR